MDRKTVERIKNYKVGMPAGIIAEEGQSLIAIESPYANISLSLIQANLRALATVI